MPLELTRILDAIGNTTPIFYKTSAGRSEYEEDNVFDRAFGASNAKVGRREIEANTRCDSKPVEMTNTEIFDFSQFANSDIRPVGLHRSPSCFSGISPCNNASPINSLFATTPSLLSSSTVNDFKGSSQTATPRLCTGKERGTTGSQNIPGGHQLHRQSDLSEIPRQLYLEHRETENSPSLLTVEQQTPASIEFSALSSPANLLSTVEPLEEVPTLDELGQKIPIPKRQCKNSINIRRIGTADARKGQGSRKVRVHTKKEVAAKREAYLLKNRQAAHECRERRKTRVAGLVERAEFFTADNTKLPYEIVQTMLELEGLRAIAVEHYRVCPNPSSELAAWIEKEVARLQYSKASALIHHADRPLAPPPQDANYTGQGTVDMLPLMGSLRQSSDDSAPHEPFTQARELNELNELGE
jgi:hypothetical protein